MSRLREDRAIHKHTLNLYAGDYEKLQAIYGTRIGAAKVIRDMVRTHINTHEERRRFTAAHRGPDDLEINRPEGSPIYE